MIDVDYANIRVDGRCYTTTPNLACLHKNGWYVVVNFWIFKKRVFVCSDCGDVLRP